MFIVSPQTVWNPGTLQVQHLPRQFFGRVTLWPRRGGTIRLWLRILLEMEVWRYLGVLVPFAAAAVIWPKWAIAISQAPILMFIAVHLVVEQSELARIAPLTFVSVQWDQGPEVLLLTAVEEALIRATLFAEGLDERLLLKINLGEGAFERDQALEVGADSAHARLAAMMPVAAPG